MALQTIHTAQIQCSFGSLPVPLALSPEKRVLLCRYGGVISIQIPGQFSVLE